MQSDHQPSPEPTTAFVDTVQLAAWLGVPVNTLCYWRKRRTGPPWIKLGHNVVRYEVARVRAWLDERSRGTGA